MDKKKVSTGLKVAGFVFAILALISFAWGAFDGAGLAEMTIFEYAFKRGAGATDTIDIHYNAIYIVSFVLALIAILSLVAMLYMNFTGKGSASIGKTLAIIAIVSLLIVVVFAFCSKGVIRGEAWKNNPGATKEEIAKEMKYIVMGQGTICQGIFGLIGAGSLFTAIQLDK